MSGKADKAFKPDLYVVARFLERLWSGQKEYRKTQLQMAVGLNYGVYKKYLDWLIRKDLVELNKDEHGKTVVSITSEGVKAYNTLVEWLKKVIDTEL